LKSRVLASCRQSVADQLSTMSATGVLCSEFARAAMRQSVCQICDDQGFISADSDALDLLACAVAQYIEAVGVSAQQLAELSARGRANITDIRDALDQCAASFGQHASDGRASAFALGHEDVDEEDDTAASLVEIPLFPRVPRAGSALAGVCVTARSVLRNIDEAEEAEKRVRESPHIPTFLPPLPPNTIGSAGNSSKDFASSASRLSGPLGNEAAATCNQGAALAALLEISPGEGEASVEPERWGRLRAPADVSADVSVSVAGFAEEHQVQSLSRPALAGAPADQIAVPRSPPTKRCRSEEQVAMKLVKTPRIAHAEPSPSSVAVSERSCDGRASDIGSIASRSVTISCPPVGQDGLLQATRQLSSEVDRQTIESAGASDQLKTGVFSSALGAAFKAVAKAAGSGVASETGAVPESNEPASTLDAPAPGVSARRLRINIRKVPND